MTTTGGLICRKVLLSIDSDEKIGPICYMPLPLNQWAFNDDEIISAPAELPVHKNLLRVLVCQGKKIKR